MSLTLPAQTVRLAVVTVLQWHCTCVPYHICVALYPSAPQIRGQGSTFQEAVKLLACSLADVSRASQYTIGKGRLWTVSRWSVPEFLEHVIAQLELLAHVDIAGRVKEGTQHGCEPWNLHHQVLLPSCKH